ncbi:ubiquitin-transferase domain containing, partial [Cystoisospora suis]
EEEEQQGKYRSFSSGTHLSSSPSCAGYVSSYLAGVSVEEVLRLIEGSRSTGDSSLLKAKLSLIFSDVYRLNCSFVYPGRGCRPDFCGLDEVYVHLPEDAIQTLGTSLLTCLSTSVKYVKYLKSGDAIKFLLFTLACFPLYGDGIEDMELDETDYTRTTVEEADDGGGMARESSQGREEEEEEERERKEEERNTDQDKTVTPRNPNQETEEEKEEDATGEEEKEKQPQEQREQEESPSSSPSQDNSSSHENSSPSPSPPPASSGSTSFSPFTGAAATSSTPQKPLGGVSKGESVFTALVHLLFNLPPEGKLEFLRLAAEFPDNLFEKRLVRMTKWFIILTLRRAGSSYRNVDRLWHAVALLQLLYLANCRTSSLSSYLSNPSDHPEATDILHSLSYVHPSSSSSSFFSSPAFFPQSQLKIPVEKFHLAGVAQLVDPIREVALYSDIAQRDQQHTSATSTSHAGGLFYSGRTPSNRTANSSSSSDHEVNRQDHEARGGGEQGGGGGGEEAEGKKDSSSENVGAKGSAGESQGDKEDEEEEKHRRKILQERARWSAFDVWRDVICSTELQSRWCFFIAHMQLCPLKFKRNVILVDNVYRQHHTGLQSLLDAELPFLLLRVHRGLLMDDTVAALEKAEPKHLRRPLKIVFEGEEGVDEGGLKREFFS